MSQQVSVQHQGEHVYEVRVREGGPETRHRVTVDDELVDNLGVVDLDEERLVHESVVFWLESLKATELPDDLDLDLMRQRFPSYLDEIRLRLGATG